MDKKISTLALATSVALGMGASSTTFAADNPFAISELPAGYQLANNMEGKCGEGKCGGSKPKASEEGKCGEGKCGGSKPKASEGKCGEGKCGGAKPKASEGKCGEGKCGGGKV